MSETSLQLKGLEASVAEVVRPRARLIGRIAQGVLIGLLPPAALMYLFMSKEWNTFLVALPIYTLILYWDYSRNSKTYSTIMLTPKSRGPGFFERNKDKIIFGVVGSIFTILITIAKAALDSYMKQP